MRIADTTVLYALFSRTDTHHKKAYKAMQDPQAIIIPSEIFAETLSLIQYRQGHQQSLDAGHWLQGAPHIDIQASTHPIIEDGWQHFRTAAGEFSFPDALVIAHAHHQRATALTFDKQIQKRV